MIVAAPHILLSLRWVPPGVAILGSAPIFLAHWTAIKILTFPLPYRFYRRLDEYLYGKYQAMVGFYYETWSGVEFCFYGDKIPNKPENVLYISNHQCSIDWVIPEVLCVKQGGYGGRARYILKDVLKFLPLYGWYLGYRGGIFVRRQKNKDQTTLIKGLKNFVENDIPVWLVIFPEGTRYSQKRMEDSKHYAHSLGLPALQHVLMPKTTGFELALKHIGTHFDAVYDITIYYETMGKDRTATPPNLFSFFCGTCSKVHVHVRRILIQDMPKDPKGQRAWLHDAYQQKDRILHELLTQGCCHAPMVSHPLPLSRSLLPTLFLSSTVLATLCTRWGRVSWLALLGGFTMVTFISALFNKR